MTHTLSQLDKELNKTSTADTVPYHPRVNEADPLVESMKDVINVLAARHYPDELITMMEDIIKQYENRTPRTIR